MCSAIKNHKIFSSLFIASFLIILSVPVFAAVDPVARLSEFSGAVLIRSQGEWGVEPAVGLPLYSDDKVVTKVGLATITFSDGAVLELKNNSNLLIYEQEKEEGFIRKTQVVQRRLRLLVGKVLFKTGTSKKNNILETPTMVCGLRGTAGTLSIGADGSIHIQFTEGGFSYVNGEFIPDSVADDVPSEIADLNPAQRAAFVAVAAAEQAKNAAALATQAAETAKTAIGTPEAQALALALAQAQAQAAYNAARAAELAAEEVKIQATILVQNNPDPEVVEQATAAISQADTAIAASQDAQEEAIDSGAVQEEPGTYIMPEVTEPVTQPGFDVPVTPEPAITDTEPASPV